MAARQRVVLILGGKGTPHYKTNSRRYFAALWRDYRIVFNVTSFRDTLERDFEKATVWIGEWVMKQPIALPTSQIEMELTV